MYNNTVSPRSNIGIIRGNPQIQAYLQRRTEKINQEEQVINLIIFLKLIHFYIKNLKYFKIHEFSRN